MLWPSVSLRQSVIIFRQYRNVLKEPLFQILFFSEVFVTFVTFLNGLSNFKNFRNLKVSLMTKFGSFYNGVLLLLETVNCVKYWDRFCIIIKHPAPNVLPKTWHASRMFLSFLKAKCKFTLYQAPTREYCSGRLLKFSEEIMSTTYYLPHV